MTGTPGRRSEEGVEGAVGTHSDAETRKESARRRLPGRDKATFFDLFAGRASSSSSVSRRLI